MEKGHEIKVLDHGFVRYIDHMGTDERIVESARISYRSPSKGPEKDKGLLNYLYRNRHTSPFEMVKISMNIKMPIFVMRQYVRHRMQNLNEVSARYTQLPSEFYIPEKWRIQDTKNKQGSLEVGEDQLNHEFYTEEVKKFCDDAYDLYQNLIDSGISREMARMVLPINIYTEIYSTWDMKNLLHFISLRDDSHAQAEIQEYGRAMKEIATELFPWTMEAYEKGKEVLNDKNALFEAYDRVRKENPDLTFGDFIRSIYDNFGIQPEEE